MRRTGRFHSRAALRLLLSAAACAVAHAQTISSVQASRIGTPAANVTSITSATNIAGFVLYINFPNNSFDPAVATSIVWNDPRTQPVSLQAAVNATGSQVTTTVPSTLFAVAVATPISVLVSVIQPQANRTSNTASFLIVPPLSDAGPLLPIATLNQAYSASLVNGGTLPNIGTLIGTTPPGITPNVTAATISGTPITAGFFSFQPTINDFWGNVLQLSQGVLVVGPAALNSLSQTSAPAGSGTLTVTLTGNNFIQSQLFNGQTVPGSSALWRAGSGVTSLNTTFVDASHLTVQIPAALLTAATTATIQVLQPNDTVSPTLNFALLAPVIGALNPPSIAPGIGGFVLTVAGANFLTAQNQTGPSAVTLNGTLLTASVINGGTIQATVPPAFANNAPGFYPVIVTNPGGSSSNAVRLQINSTLAFATTFLPEGTAGLPYSTVVVASGGAQPYTFTATGLPPGLVINPLTGVVSGTTTTSGTFAPVFTVTDAVNTRATTQLALTIGPPPLRISTPSQLPNGVVGAAYAVVIATNGGVDPITFTLAGGSVPPGLTFNNSLLSGTPTTAGTFTFTVRVFDANNATDSRGFSIVIQPAPLSIPGGPANPTATAGAPLNINLGCTGGVPPYTYSVTGPLPPGVTFANCTLSGTPTTPGSFPIHIVVTDSAGSSAARDITITVVPAALTLTGGALPDGRVGVAYTASVSATGGVPPITYSGTGLPGGLTLSSSGAIAGTPTAAGQFSFRVTATDSSRATAPVTATATFTITIAPPTLAFGAASLTDGRVGVAYSASLTGTGGVPPYSFAFSGLPGGLSGTSAGAVSGTPTQAGTFDVIVTLTDAANGRVIQTYRIQIAPAALAIPTASAPNGTVGTAYSAIFTATGGTPPYTFSATGQPQTLTMSAAGTLSGTPTAAGTISITVSVRDSTGATTSKSFTFSIALPAPPPLNFGGISATVNPLQQPRVTVSLASPYPVDVLATLTLSSQPVSGPVDPAIAFVTGGNTATINIPAGSLNGATDVGFQTGSVAGTITITARLTASGGDVTPSPAPTFVTRVAAGAPVLVTVTAARTATGFTVTVVGYVTDREVTTGNFTFNGTNLGTTSLAVPVSTLFTGWFGGNQPPSAPFGGQFTYTQTFTVNGSNTAIASVTVTLTNNVGTSNSVSVNLN